MRINKKRRSERIQGRLHIWREGCIELGSSLEIRKKEEKKKKRRRKERNKGDYIFGERVA